MARKRDESVSIVVSGRWLCFMTCTMYVYYGGAGRRVTRRGLHEIYHDEGQRSPEARGGDAGR